MEELAKRETNTSEVRQAATSVRRKLDEMIVFASVVQNQSAQAMGGNKDNKEYLYGVNVSCRFLTKRPFFALVISFVLFD